VGGVLVLNSCGTVLTTVDWQRAVTLLVTTDAKGIPLAVMHEADPEKAVHSPSTTVAFPRVIRMTRWVYVKYRDRSHYHDGGVATRHGVLNRDKHTCVYCAAHADTVDHVFPESRGGRYSWENLAACCRPCNHRKGNLTPEEAGMRLRWHPYRPDLTGYTQRKIWADLADLQSA